MFGGEWCFKCYLSRPLSLSLSLSPYVICQFRLLNYICSFFDQQYFFHNVYLLRSNTYMSPLGKVYVLNPFLTISTKNFLFTIDKFRPTQPHPSSLSLHTHLHAKCLTITPSLYGHTFFSTYTNTPYQALISCLFLSNEQLFFSLSLKSTLSQSPSLSLSLTLSISLTHTQAHLLILPLSFSILKSTLSHTIPLFLSQTHTFSFPPSLSVSKAHFLIYSLSLFKKQTFSFSPSLSLSL